MKRYKSNYVNPAGDKFPIVANSPCKTKERYPPRTLFDQIADCGFTVIMQDRRQKISSLPNFDPQNPDMNYNGSNYDIINEFLDRIKSSNHRDFPLILGTVQLDPKSYVEEKDNKVTILFNDIDELKIRELVKRYKDVANIKMWNITDEPSPLYYSLVKTCVDIVREVSSKPVFINLLAMDPSTLNRFINEIKPDLLSLDYYPIEESCEKIFDNNYYNQLALFSKTAKKNQIPFWTNSLSVGFYNQGRFPCPDATEESLRFEAFSALAYGAQGISYFRYSRDHNSSTESYSSALIDDNFKVTPQWYYAQKVNAEVQKYADIFLDCEANPVHAAPESFFEKATDVERITYPFGPIKYLWYDGLGVLISKIAKDSDNYIIIVNHSPFNFQKVSFYPNIPINEMEFVNSPYKFAISQLNSEKGASDESGIPAKRLVELGPYLEFTLPPGGYQIIKYP